MRALLAALALTLGSGTLAQTPVYAPYTVEALSKRSFDGGPLKLVRVLERNAAFTRWLVNWQSEGTTQVGFLNLPPGSSKKPVVIVIHGYVNPRTYPTLGYTTRYADALARAGFVTLHPNLRGHGVSGGTPDGRYRVGYASDVLSLLSSLRQSAGKGALSSVDARRIGLWGHSMGGGIAQRVMVLDRGVRAVALYGAMSADERKNAEQVYYVYSGRSRGLFELNTPKAWLEQISPASFLNRVNAAVSIHHGTADEQVPHAWSVETCGKLRALKKSVECFSYANAPHLFGRGSRTDATFRSRVEAFFRRELGR